MSSWGEAWEATEWALTEWLAGTQGHTLGVEAWRAEDFPRALPHGDDEAAIWCLSLGGGEVGIHRQERAEIPGGIWHVNGEIVVRGRRAPTVRRMAAELFGALPAGPGDVANVARLYPTAYPTLNRILIPAADAALENELGFESRIGVRCAFQNPKENEE